MNTTPIRDGSRVTGDLASLVARTDLHQLLERYSGPGRANGSTVTYSCPNPAHPDRSPSFTVTTRSGKQYGRCWSQCDWRGDALDLVSWLEGVDTAAAADHLRGLLGESARKVAKRNPVPVPVVLQEDAPRPPSDAAETFLEKYLRSRDWPREVAEAHGLEVVLDQTGTLRVRHKYLAPVGGEWCVTYWQDRGPKSSRVKWLSPKGAKPVPYNLRSLERDDLSAVVVCEGPADAITAELALDGVPGVAVIGIPGVSAWRPEWGTLLDGLRVVIAADHDAAGERLESAVKASTRGAVAVVRFSHGDLTETALEKGREAVREVLLAGLRKQPTAEERSLEESVRLLLEAFPEAREVTR